MMSNKEFISILSKKINVKLNIKKENLFEILKEVKKLAIDVLLKGQKLKIQQFGTFELKQKNERFVYNVYYNKMQLVPPKKVVIFKCSKKLHLWSKIDKLKIWK